MDGRRVSTATGWGVRHASHGRSLYGTCCYAGHTRETGDAAWTDGRQFACPVRSNEVDTNLPIFYCAFHFILDDSSPFFASFVPMPCLPRQQKEIELLKVGRDRGESRESFVMGTGRQYQKPFCCAMESVLPAHAFVEIGHSRLVATECVPKRNILLKRASWCPLIRPSELCFPSLGSPAASLTSAIPCLDPHCLLRSSSEPLPQAHRQVHGQHQDAVAPLHHSRVSAAFEHLDKASQRHWQRQSGAPPGNIIPQRVSAILCARRI